METPVSPIQAQKTNVLSIVSLVTGIIGFLSTCLGIFVVVGQVCMGLFGLAGIITGFIGLGQVKRNPEKGKGMAIAGIILGVLTMIGLCLAILIPLIFGPVINNVFTDLQYQLMP